MKTIKIYLKHCPAGPRTQIYCIKHEAGEDLMTLKEKIFRRCPSLRSANDPVIYWIDLENDKIRINCDDDLRFFMEESKINKLTFEFEQNELNDPIVMRKRPPPSIDSDVAEYSKRLRTKMEQIDLTDSSSMELSSDSENEQDEETSAEPMMQENVSSTTSVDNEPRVNIISVDIIKEADNANPNATNAKNVTAAAQLENIEEEVYEIEDEQPTPSAPSSSPPKEQESAANNAQKERKNSGSNRIVISDSSDDEENEDDDRNFRRRYSDGNYTSAYSFANVNGDRYDSRASFDDDFRRYNHHRRRREHFNEHARSTYRNCSENMQRIFSQANSAREQAMRNFRNSANLIPDLLTTFQSHFGPLFHQQQHHQSRSRYNQQFPQNFNY